MAHLEPWLWWNGTELSNYARVARYLANGHGGPRLTGWADLACDAIDEDSSFLASYPNVVLADAPYLWLRLGESAGTTAEDSSGNNRDGTYVNTPTLGATGLISGDSDKAVTFTAAQSEYVNLDGSQVWRTTGYSVEFWVKAATPGALGVVYGEGRSASNDGNFYLGITTAGKLQVLVESNAPATLLNILSVATVGDNAAHHVVFTDSNGTYALYIDGVVDSSGVYAPSTFTPNKATVGALGRVGYGQFFNGTADEVATYNRALSAAEVAEHYDSRTVVVPVSFGTSPLADPAPWYDADAPESAEFLGLALDPDHLVISPDNARVRVAASIGHGIGGLRRGGLHLKAEGVLLGKSCRGLDYGERWLEGELSVASLVDARVLKCCPEDAADDQFRLIRRVGLVRGPADITPAKWDPCTIRRVVFEMASELPWLYGEAEYVMAAAAFADPPTTSALWAAAVLAYSPAGFWRMGDAALPTMADSSPNARNGTYVNSPTIGQASVVPGDVTNNSVDYDGTNDHASVADNAAWDQTSYTVGLWFKRGVATAPGAQPQFLATRDVTLSGLNLWRLTIKTTGHFEAVGRAGAIGQVLTGGVVLDTLAHLGVLTAAYDAIADATTFSLYLDGVLQTTATIAGAPPASTEPIYFARDPDESTRYFDGQLDEAFFIPSALTTAQAGDLYSRGLSARLPVDPNSVSIENGRPDQEMATRITIRGGSTESIVRITSSEIDPNDTNESCPRGYAYGRWSEATSVDTTGGAGNMAMSRPAYHAGDVWVAMIGYAASGTTPTPPAGWTQIVNAVGTSPSGVGVWTKAAEAADPASWNWVFSAAWAAKGTIVSMPGVDADAITAVASAVQGGTSATPTATTIIPAEPARLLYVAFINSDSTFTPPPGMAERFDLAGGVWGMEVAEEWYAAAGVATGSRVGTATTSAEWAATLIAIRAEDAIYETDFTATVPADAVLVIDGTDRTVTLTDSAGVESNGWPQLAKAGAFVWPDVPARGERCISAWASSISAYNDTTSVDVEAIPRERV